LPTPHSPSRAAPRRATAAALLSAALLLLAACGGDTPPRADTSPFRERKNVFTIDRPPIRSAALNTAESGSNAEPLPGGAGGVEVRAFALAGDAAPFAESIATLPGAAPADPAAETTWRAAGLRALRLPRAQLPRLAATVNPDALLGIVDTRWIPAASLWIEVLREPGERPPRPIALHDSVFAAPAGHGRLLARCWLIPQPPAAPNVNTVVATLRVELVPQFVGKSVTQRRNAPLTDPAASGSGGPTGGPDPSDFAPPAPRTIADAGLILDRLGLNIPLSRDEVLLVFPEPPPAPTPTDPSPPPPARAPGDVTRADASASVTAAEPAAPPATGPIFNQPPRLFRIPSLGETLLFAQSIPIADDRPPIRTTMVLLIIPWIPERFTILGDP
jgi:hypothetical protein